MNPHPVFQQTFAVLLHLFLSLCLSLQTATAYDIQTLVLVPEKNMNRAELHYLQTPPTPKAVLVLCPGVNGSGDRLISSSVWQEFAKAHHLGLVGLSFASPSYAIHDGSGYYYASKGSGQLLLEGIRQIYGDDLPLVLCGFSGGAHFTSRFTEWKPERVLTWCAYSAGWWDMPVKAKITPPGIVACGDEDHRYGASLIYFKQGRAAGKPWLWLSLPKTGHTSSEVLNEFVRNYFSTILTGNFHHAIWVDIDMKTRITKAEAEHQPSLSGWLPSENLLQPWKGIHEP